MSSIGDLRSTVPGVNWPAVPDATGARLLSLQYQLERSQWWTPEELQASQFEQLRLVIEHACNTVPYYRNRPALLQVLRGKPFALADFQSVPLLTRADVQTAGNSNELLSRTPPPDHGLLSRQQSSGSTGRPVVSYDTELVKYYWLAFTLREHLWHQRDFSGKLAVIRSGSKAGTSPAWGPATNLLFDTGPCVTLEIETSVDHQLAWLQQENPDYLLTYASNLHALAQLTQRRGIKLPALKGVRSISETLPEAIRETCREVWNVALTDVYSAQEVGYIALQCPEHQHYHVQSESLLVEILNADGSACQPGEIGKVVITTLQNFAMPLIRYFIGDYAQAGRAPCPCGRGLPVIERIMGRSRNMLHLADGSTYWPMLGTSGFPKIAPILQHQFIQHSLTRLELRMVTARPLSEHEEAQLRALITSRLPTPLQIDISYVADIARTAGGKFEDFVAMLRPS